MITLYISLISVFGAMIFVRLPFIFYLKLWLKRTSIKPFDCSFCMTGWIALVLGLIVTGQILYSIALCLALPFITAVCEYFYTKITNKI